MLLIMGSLILIVGLVFEAGNLLSAKREAERVAFESARAGAAEVSLESLYRGESPALAPTEARASATTWAQDRDFDVLVNLEENDRVIEVTITRSHPFLWGFFGGPATIEASSRAIAADGAAAAGRTGDER